MVQKLEELVTKLSGDSSSYQAAADGAAKANERLADSSEKVDAAIASTQRTMGVQSRGFNRVVSDIDPAFKSQQRYATGLNTLQSAYDRGRISADEYGRLTGLLKAKYDTFSKSLDTSTKSLGLNRFQMLTVQYTINDVIASLASGASPLTIFLQQGGQVTQAFGGIGGTLRALLTPLNLFRLGLIGVAGGFVAALYSADKAELIFRRISVSLADTGRASLLSRQQIESLIQTIDAVPGVSYSDAVKSAEQLARTRQVAIQQYPQLIRFAGDYAALEGKTLPIALEELANRMKDPIQFAAAMEERFGRLTYAQFQHVAALAESGNEYAANNIIIEAYGKRLDGTAEKLQTPFRQAIDRAKNSFDRFKESLVPGQWATDFFNFLDKAEQKFFGLSRIILEDWRLIKRLNADSSGNAPRVGFTASTPSQQTLEKYAPKEDVDTKLSNLKQYQKDKEAARKFDTENEAAFNKLLGNLKKEREERESATKSVQDYIDKANESAEVSTLDARSAAIANGVFSQRSNILKLAKEDQDAYTQAVANAASREYDAKEAAAKHAKEIEDLRSAFDSTGKTISSSFVQSMLDGQSALQGFGNLLRKIIEDLADFAVASLVTDPLKDWLAPTNKTGGTGSFIGSTLSTLFGGFFASGGDVSVGKHYVVGENGPETFTPRSAGTITPVSRASNVAPVFNFNVTVSGPASQSDETSRKAGIAFSEAARATVIDIIQKEKLPGGSLYSAI